MIMLKKVIRYFEGIVRIKVLRSNILDLIKDKNLKMEEFFIIDRAEFQEIYEHSEL